MLRILVIFILLYFGFRFFFRTLLPFFATLVAKNLFSRMNPNEQAKKQKPVSNKKEEDDGEFIDYEEVKEK